MPATLIKGFSLLMQCCGILLLSFAAVAQTDTIAAKKHAKPREDYGHQLRFSFDISRPIVNALQHTNTSYEAQVDYYLSKDVYAVAEGGFGSAKYDYPDLSYKSANSFFRLGLDKTLIRRLGSSDWDAAFAGIRYGVAFINRGEASWTIIDSLWGNSSGTVPAKTFTAHWAEITGGVRVELLQNVFAGWNIRGRFLLNERAFRELSPVFIAGYGQGDKTVVFDFNFFLGYALRWGGKALPLKGE